MNLFQGGRDPHNINQMLLILTIIILLIALWICIMISRKNKLYITTESMDEEQKNLKGNEVI